MPARRDLAANADQPWDFVRRDGDGRLELVVDFASSSDVGNVRGTDLAYRVHAAPRVKVLSAPLVGLTDEALVAITCWRSGRGLARQKLALEALGPLAVNVLKAGTLCVTKELLQIRDCGLHVVPGRPA